MIALLFGNWHAVHLQLDTDIWAILYVAFGTTFLPTLMTVLLQKYIAPLTVSFIYILEPVLGAIFAYMYLHESMPLAGYIGGAVIVIGAVVNTWGMAQQPATGPTLRQRLLHHVHASPIGTLVYPLVCFSVGGIAVYKLGGLPPTSWYQLYHLWPHVASNLQHVSTPTILLIAQALCWLIAWSALVSIGTLAIYRALRRLFGAKTPASAAQYNKAMHKQQTDMLDRRLYEKQRRQMESRRSRQYGSSKQLVDAMELAD
jgi:hypothetical protein